MQHRLIFRVDGNTTIGRGHVSRCLAIAAMLKEDLDILFIGLRSNRSYMSVLLDGFKSDYIKDEEGLKLILEKEDLLWIDGYHFSEDWKKEMRSRVYKLIETNDLPYTPKNVDVLINHTPGLTKEQFGGEASSAKLFIGLKYALLRPQFLKLARSKSTTTLSGQGVFICFGGADTYNLGKKIVNELIKLNFKDAIYWVTNSHETSENLSLKNVSILSSLSENEMILYMSKSRVVYIPSSVLSFEAMALRKPIFTCYFAENQQLINEGLINENLTNGIGLIKTDNDVREATLKFLKYYSNTSLHKKEVRKQVEFLDGCSSRRINEFINEEKFRK